MNEMAPNREKLEELRQRKDMFDNTWMLAIVLSASSIIVFWYLGLGEIDIVPIIWTLAALGALQYGINWWSAKCKTAGQLRFVAEISQLTGICVMGVAWHLFGGLQQPTFPMFMMLPLFTGALILNFWQQQTTLAVFLVVLASGVLLSPDTNSFIAERYGLSVLSTQLLPAWIPRSRVAFLDVSTSPTYNLMLTGSLAILTMALSATSRSIIAFSMRLRDQLDSSREELVQARELNVQIIESAPAAEVLLTPTTGRIQHASQRFEELFGSPTGVVGRFILDSVSFAYPIVIKRLMTMGGEEIQGATVRGREAVLRVRAVLIGTGSAQMVRLTLESCDEICWRGAVDALDQPVFAVNSRGTVIFLNRTAVAVFGAQAEYSPASTLFDSGPGMTKWWDIGPLENARRMVSRGEHRYLASIRRERIAESIADLSFVHLHEREDANVVATT